MSTRDEPGEPVEPSPELARSPSTDRYRSVFRTGLFEGRTVVVTGGGSGLGPCTVHQLASLGARLASVGPSA